MDDESLESYHTAEESDEDIEGFYKITSSGGYPWILPLDVWSSYDTWELIDMILLSFK